MGDLDPTCHECRNSPDSCDCDPAAARREPVRHAKTPAARKARPQAAALPMAAADVVSLADVPPEHVAWIWPRYLPRGKIVVLDGDPGVGKSTVAADIAARITTGSLMPDGSEPVKGAVLILSAEDGLADTVRPRIDAAGGDPAQVIAITAVKDDGAPPRPVSLPADIPVIEAVVRDRGAVLVIIDVLMAYLAAGVDAHRDQDVRRALHPLAEMAARADCTVLALRHLSKTGGSHAVYRGGGSIGIIGAARAAFMCGTDPEDDSGTTRVLAPVKNNLSAPPPALAYRLETDPQCGCARICWAGQTTRTAADMLADRGGDEERIDRDEAAEWLTGWMVRHGGEGKAGEIFADGRQDGFAKHTLQRARKRAHVITVKTGMQDGWVWRFDPAEGDRR